MVAAGSTFTHREAIDEGLCLPFGSGGNICLSIKHFDLTK